MGDRELVTVEDFGSTHGKSVQFFLPTFSGFARVGYIRKFDYGQLWAVCPELNGGFGLSFMVCRDTELYSEACLVETFGSMKQASLICEQAGGSVYRANDGAFRMQDYMTGKDVPVEAEGGDAVLPQYGARVRAGGEFGEVKQVQCHEGAYSFRVELDGGERSEWYTPEELKVVRLAPASDLGNY